MGRIEQKKVYRLLKKSEDISQDYMRTNLQLK